MESRPRVVRLACLLFGAATLAPAQEKPPAIADEVVRLDAVISDSSGAPVRDLVQEDLVLLEDGKPQRLTHFAFAGRSRDSIAPATAPPADAAGPARQVAIVVDDLHIAAGNLDQVKQALRRFVGELAQPGDNVALVTSSARGGVQVLTRARGPLNEAIEQLKARGSGPAPMRGSQMTPVLAELILRGDPGAMTLAARAIVYEPGSVVADMGGLRSGSQGPGGVGLGSSSSEDRIGAVELQQQARIALAEALSFSVATLNRIEDVVRGLSPLPGRKICLLVSDGFLLGAGTSEERTRELRRVVDAATRSGTVVYALDAKGLASAVDDLAAAGAAGPPSPQIGVATRGEALLRDTLATVAGDTGGFLVRGTSDLEAGLRRVLAENEAYYGMAYEPSNKKRDGAFRKIELKIPGHRDYVVRTRRGYLAPDDRRRARRPEAAAEVALPRPLDETEARAILGSPVPEGGVPVQLIADYLELPPNGPQAVVRAYVDVGRLAWQEAEGRRRAALELIGGLYDAQGNPTGDIFGTRRVLDVARADSQRVEAAGFQFEHRLPLGPGRYQVRVAARGAQDASLGGAQQWLEIPDLSDKKLAVSSVFLSAAAPTQGGLGVPAGGDTMRDVHTRRRFKPGDGLYFQFYVYNARVDDSGASDVVLQAQIWSGKKALAASKPKPAALETKNGTPLPETNGMSLDGIAAGLYELRVVVVDRKANATVSRSVDFSVE
jgi:VWFA-related protein